jgi:drug/metabolite transporter (DMT)-like permease
MAWISIFTALFLGAMTYMENRPLLPPDLESVLVLSMLGVISQAIGWWTITYAMGKINTSKVALILLLQPSLATIWGVLFFAENLGLIQYIGASIILIAIYLGSVKKVGGLQ